MTRETENQMGLLERQLEHDRDMQALERLHALISSGAKGLSVLGGGAVVATLAFVQALIEKPAYLDFKPFAIGALACFLVAAFLPSIAFFFHFDFLNKPHHEGRDKKLNTVWRLLGTSAALLFFGGLVIFVGVWVAL